MPGWRGKKKRNASAIGRSVRGRGRGGGRGGRGGKQVRETTDEKERRTEQRERWRRECEGGREIYEREAVGRNGWGERESRKGKGGKEAMNGDSQARGIEETKVERASERETWGAGGRGPAEFRARYAIWRYRGQRLVRNTKLFMNGRKLSLKL